MSFSFAVAPTLFPSLSLSFILRFLLLPACLPACWSLSNCCRRQCLQLLQQAAFTLMEPRGGLAGRFDVVPMPRWLPQPPTAFSPLSATFCGERPVAFIVTNWVRCVCVCVCEGWLRQGAVWRTRPSSGHSRGIMSSAVTQLVNVSLAACGKLPALPYLAWPCLAAEVDASRKRRSWQTSILFYYARWVLQPEGETVKWVCNVNSSELFKLKRIEQQQQIGRKPTGLIKQTKKSISNNNLIYLFAVLFLHDCN